MLVGGMLRQVVREEHEVSSLPLCIHAQKYPLPHTLSGRSCLESRGGVSFFFFSFFFFFFFHLTIADGPHHYHPACGHKGSSHLSPVHALQFFYRDASSALLQLVNQWLNFTYSRSHAFRYERKNTNYTLVRIELTTSVLADVQLTY